MTCSLHCSLEGLTIVPLSVSDTVLAEEILFRKYTYVFSWTQKSPPMPIAFVLWGNLRHSTTVSQKLFCFLVNLKGCCSVLSNFLYKRYNKSKYSYSNSTNSYGVPTMCLALCLV